MRRWRSWAAVLASVAAHALVLGIAARTVAPERPRPPVVVSLTTERLRFEPIAEAEVRVDRAAAVVAEVVVAEVVARAENAAEAAARAEAALRAAARAEAAAAARAARAAAARAEAVPPADKPRTAPLDAPEAPPSDGPTEPRAQAPARPGAWHPGDPRNHALDLALPASPDGPRASTGDGDAAHPSSAPETLGLRPAGGGRYTFEDSGFVAEIDQDGTVHIADRLPVGFASPVALTFDLTEAVMMLRGDDPYRHQKMKFLERTRDLRARMCGQAHSERLRLALRTLPRELEQIWRDPSRTVEERRRLLFERWDECADERAGDEVARAGAMARATVLAFIRRELPQGSTAAYTHEELLAFNARRASRDTFAPYASAPDAGT